MTTTIFTNLTTITETTTANINQSLSFESFIIHGSNAKNVKAVLLICSSLSLILLVAMIYFMCVRKSKSGYENIPIKESKEHESAADIISEITGRREVKMPPLPKVPTQTSQLGTQQSNVQPSQAQLNTSNKASGSVLHVFPSQTTNDETKVQEDSKVASDSNLISLEESQDLPKTSIKLIPHDRLSHPRTQNLIRATSSKSEPSFTKVSMDEILSLSTIEKLKTRPNSVLKPKITPSPSHTSIEIAEQLQPELQIEQELLPEPLQELTLQQKKEEWDKFLKAFSNNLSSRRRSLCTIEDLDELDSSYPTLNAVAATKVQSMPAMSVGPFISESEALASVFNDDERPVVVPPSLQFSPLGNLSKKISSMSLKTKELEEMTAAFSLLTKLSKGTKLSASPKTSSTSIWSSVASENAYEPEPEKVILCSRRTSFEEIPVMFKGDNRMTDSNTEDNSENEEEIYEKAPNVLGVRTSKIKTKQSAPEIKVKRLTTAERIDLAAKLLGYASPEGSNDTGFLFESDLMPSEIFPTTRESSAVSSTDQFWASEKKAVRGYEDNFWAQGIVNTATFAKETQTIDELDPYRITSKLKQALTASKAKSFESLNIKFS